jgi:signal transduction histidine kinase
MGRHHWHGPGHRRWHQRWQEHVERHHLQHLRHHLRHPGGFRYYFGAHLHRRIFMWFGASIFVTSLIMALVSHATGGRGPGRGVLALFIAGCTLWILSGKIARRIARPLSELVHVAEEIGAGRLRTRAEVPPWQLGEIGVLSRAINDMAARIEQQIADQRELLAGVSHEIRTPLARIRVLLEIGRQQEPGAAAGAGAPRAVLDELEREVIEIDALVGELLASARLDFAALSPRPLDARDVARRALERAAVPASALAADAGDGAGGRFHADPTLVARALANMLDNARRHGGGVEALHVRARPGWIAFEVTDRGPGFPAGVAESLAAGKRDPSNPPKADNSLGLGLVLVRRIADAHHGALAVGNRPGGGARAVLELPVGAPPREAEQAEQAEPQATA